MVELYKPKVEDLWFGEKLDNRILLEEHYEKQSFGRD